MRTALVTTGRGRADDSVVRFVLAERAKGASYRAIAHELAAKGVPTPQGGRRWYASTVRWIALTHGPSDDA